MKRASDLIVRSDQASYLDAVHAVGVRSLASLAGIPSETRDPLLTRMEARVAERGYPISDPEVACLLSVVARLASPSLVVELGTNIGYGAIVLARAAGSAARVVTIEYSSDLVDRSEAGERRRRG